ncbi:MAG: hypothetical protein HYR56_19315 [Acidobacteria bacterium]|nr:hypothetical protein [Acidobacteriota bacterium]MBI3426145.1 hypothetical protein [Acidobacteriota bacterium]
MNMKNWGWLLQYFSLTSSFYVVSAITLKAATSNELKQIKNITAVLFVFSSLCLVLGTEDLTLRLYVISLLVGFGAVAVAASKRKTKQ